MRFKARQIGMQIAERAADAEGEHTGFIVKGSVLFGAVNAAKL